MFYTLILKQHSYCYCYETKFRRIRVPTRDSFSSRVLKVCYLSRVEAQFINPDSTRYSYPSKSWISNFFWVAKLGRVIRRNLHETILSGRVTFTGRHCQCGYAVCLPHNYSVLPSAVVHWHWKREKFLHIEDWSHLLFKTWTSWTGNWSGIQQNTSWNCNASVGSDVWLQAFMGESHSSCLQHCEKENICPPKNLNWP